MTLIASSLLFSFSTVAAIPNHVAYNTGDAILKPMIMSRFVEMSSARKVPNLAFSDTQGNVIHLNQFKGKLVFIHLWATWCAPCIKEIPQIDAIRQQNADKDLVVIPLSIDEESEKVAPFLAKYNLADFKTWLDPNMDIDQIMPANVVPATYILDGSGNLVGFLRGYLDWSDKDIQPYLEKLTAKYAGK
ncbi:TlpA family protein disulfide reductase [Shewanella intestini]|uniref:TlpA family protein disulfide reductase n=2 Tax=Shewanellaceae TaxID=267890 RepID=A0ABS5I434_9GAMM|nr:TlpA family protein disulfide reductase [Shewanella intestini]MRG36872.1 redoxin domain-containing protein [Shewanella sp. XMDDZSB0408]